MLTQEQQKSVSLADWSALWKKRKAERLAQAKELEATLKTHGVVDSKAVLQFEDGKKISLRRESSRWRLNQALVNRTVANTPEDAVTLFSTAIAQRDIEKVLRILSKRHREGIESKIKIFHDSLSAELKDPQHEVFLVNPTRAEMTWSAGDIRYRIVLLKEDNDWFLDDIQIGPDPTFEEPEKEEAEKAKK